MTDESPDELGGEVSIRAQLDATGLTVGGKSRALAAADRLLGGLVGIPAAYLEGVRARVEARGAGRLALIQADARMLPLGDSTVDAVVV